MNPSQVDAITAVLERIADALEKQTALQLASSQTANNMIAKLGIWDAEDDPYND